MTIDWPSPLVPIGVLLLLIILAAWSLCDSRGHGGGGR